MLLDIVDFLWFLGRFSSVAQSCLTLPPHGLQHARLPCPPPTPEACWNSCPSSRWCHSTVSSSVVLWFYSWIILHCLPPLILCPFSSGPVPSLVPGITGTSFVPRSDVLGAGKNGVGTGSSCSSCFLDLFLACLQFSELSACALVSKWGQRK